MSRVDSATGQMPRSPPQALPIGEYGGENYRHVIDKKAPLVSREIVRGVAHTQRGLNASRRPALEPKWGSHQRLPVYRECSAPLLSAAVTLLRLG